MFMICNRVVVVYLTTHQRHMGYSASRNEHPVGRYKTPRFKKADAIG